jgi:hypothetical protein
MEFSSCSLLSVPISNSILKSIVLTLDLGVGDKLFRIYRQKKENHRAQHTVYFTPHFSAD